MDTKPRQDNSKTILAFVLIGIGMLWILQKIGVYFEFTAIHLKSLFLPLQTVFHGVGRFIFSWQVIFIIIGLVLMAGRRSYGLVFIVIGGIFLIPKIFYFPHLSISFLLPVFLIGLGVAMVARHV